MGELLLEDLALADIAAVEHDAADVLVVEQVGHEDLERALLAVAVHERALDRLSALGVVGDRGGDEPGEPAAVAGLDQLLEEAADDLLGRVAEHALDRWALVADLPAGTEHGDEIARVLHERAEAGFAAPPVHLLGERDAVEGERHLRGQRSERSLDRRSGPPRSRDDEPLGRATARRDLDDRGRVGAGRCGARNVIARGREQLEAVVLADAAEQRRGRLPRERARRVHRDIVDLRPAGRPYERGTGGREHPLARERALLLADQPGHPHDDEAEEGDRGGRHHDHVDVAALEVVHEADRRRDQRRARQQRQPESRQHRVATGRPLLDLPHRRMQCRRAPQEVEADPADVEPELVDVGAVEDQQAVDEVGRQQQDDARADQVERGRAPAAVEREPDRRREQQHVPERICDRHQLGDRRQLVVVQVRRHQRDPLRQREPDRQDQPVDHAAAVAATAAAPDQRQQPGHQHGVNEHVGGIAERRERDVAVQQQRVAVRVEVAEPEQRESDREQGPGRDRARPVHPHADVDRHHRGEPEEVHHRPAAAERRHQDVGGRQHRAERQVRDPGRRAAHVSRRRPVFRLHRPGSRAVRARRAPPAPAGRCRPLPRCSPPSAGTGSRPRPSARAGRRRA